MFFGLAYFCHPDEGGVYYTIQFRFLVPRNDKEWPLVRQDEAFGY
ncbi:hypothetical protein C943_00889 [Mariniradius saccharolyticus AK6]|uniref:Uncharacterized protein n=1 Tax=Mariniradius saccharolyticus AK6 TaxID=1239962 RepID=M7XWM4_9BACT|nr:hypothetical protein C943_00889 [Mariniradius saccharolyticus AK6]